MLALLIIMYLWASATIGLMVYFVEDENIVRGVIFGLLWPIVFILVIFTVIIELITHGRN